MARSVSQWNWSDFSQEWSQTAAINELNDDIGAERRSRRRELETVKSELGSGLERVDTRLDSVADQVALLLTWTDLRFQLLELDEYQARREIRSAFRALAEGRPARLPDLPDLPGYWLPPAAAAILPLVFRGRPGADARKSGGLTTGLDAARGRDAVRAELFNLAVGRCFGQAVLVDAAFLRLIHDPADLGECDKGLIANGWRALWEHAALGAFGPAAVVQLTGRLRELFDPNEADEAELAAWDSAITGFGAAEGETPPLADACNALRVHLGAEPATADLAELERSDGRWRRYLEELIEEPSPAEHPIVGEMESLGLDDGPDRSRPSWAEPAGTPAALVRRDLFDPEAPVALRRLALDLAAPLLRARLAHLEATTTAPEPTVTAVRRRGESIDVTAAGHDADALTAAEERIGRGFDTDGPSKLLHTGFAVVLGAAALGLAAFGLWVLAALAALAVLLPVVVYRRDAAKAREQAERRDERLAELRGALFAARADASEADKAAAAAHRADRTALERLVKTLPETASE
ncbi:hypothetical protein SAMN05216298_4000 [Glycomyces sambucus]|uniref:Uncharacterized protein n=1 Tax=Glycomyces sambucus TaxID=380244 RepID=A0A1G9KDC0_9ACTN|nr:hypothetical protein [Glycomyces sambucus]SDL47798.1 hypothetical protein SAMN05216298_4000 [Glycomyces sambucus]